MAVDDVYNLNAYGTLATPAPGVLANDSDPNGDPLRDIKELANVAGVMKNGCLRGLPRASFSVRLTCHSNQPSAGTKARPDFQGSRQNRLLASVSTRALIAGGRGLRAQTGAYPPSASSHSGISVR